MRCTNCGAEIRQKELCDGRIATVNAGMITYWLENPTNTVITMNGEEVFAGLQGPIKDAHGIGYLLHQCPAKKTRRKAHEQ